MLSLKSISLGLLVAAFASNVAAIDVTRDPAKVAALKNAASQLDRLALLPDDSDWLFDFTEQKYYTFAPGGVINANAATFPAAVGNGQTMAILNLGPCSMLPMHYHPRASNFVVAVAGTTMTYMFEENGARVVTQTLTPGKMTIFPQASMHMMMNIGCENAQLVSALNSEDAGTMNFGNGIFADGFPADLVNAALGYQDLANNHTAAGIPAVGTGSVYGTKECLARCAARKRRNF
ncbi:hypothetical protein LTR66_000885 [Elasticomyces elasticus]|nr:hypothetical protein LTR28_012061 [Elasticomyces elasticus]KAK5000221.1 hypothetical protein LTR66_000885 [Elasticomyces elasticus]